MTTREAKRSVRRRIELTPQEGRKRRPLVLGLLVVGAVLIAGWLGLRSTGVLQQASRPRHILLITMDTTRADYLGCMGRTTAQTPNLDRLAREGTLFTRCATASPLTLPSHSSIMTGVYPYAHGARQNGTGHLAPSNVTVAELLKEAGFATAATVAAFVLNAQFGVDQGFDVYHDVVPAVAGNPLMGERKGDEVCDDALQMLDKLAANPHFFLWVHFYDPHYPYESPRIKDNYSPNAYADEITFMDAQIGRLVDKLRALGRERDTLVVIVADHGEGLGQHDELTHGYLLYDSTVHVPLIFYCPGLVPAARTVAAQVRTIDLAPTVLDLTGIPALERAQGVSLAPLLSGQTEDLHLTAYSEAFDAQIEFGLSQLRSLSAGQWKYILAPQPEVYNVRTDPGETQNLLVAQGERAAEMRGALHELLADAPAPPGQEEAPKPLTGSETERLKTLGYVTAPNAFAEEGVTELDRFEPRGGDPKDYIHLFRLLIRDLPELQARQEYVKAEQLLRPMIEALPTASRLYVHLAAVLIPQGRTEEARQAFDKAVELAPNDYDVRRKRAAFLVGTKCYEEAVRELEEVLRWLPDDTISLEQSATGLVALGRFEEARANLLRGLEIEPKSARLCRALGVLAEQQDDLPEAAKRYRSALDLDPNNPTFQEDLARVQERLWK